MLNCPSCGTGKTIVIDSRERVDVIRRRRKCLSCGYRYTTRERVDPKYFPLDEENNQVREYRKKYPIDTRTDMEILECLREVKKQPIDQMLFVVVYLTGLI